MVFQNSLTLPLIQQELYHKSIGTAEILLFFYRENFEIKSIINFLAGVFDKSLKKRIFRKNRFLKAKKCCSRTIIFYKISMSNQHI